MMGRMSPVGRFAPSPTGTLHLGNLRTALASWLSSAGAGGRWLVRMEDLDRVTSPPAHAEAQLADLARLGMRPDGPAVFQSARFDRYREAIAQLRAAGRVYECFCTRREIREAASAPHGAPLAYPGTCRDLTIRQRGERRRRGRPPALRLRIDEVIEFDDLVAGRVGGATGDVVLQRNDGVPAYHLAVVVDDADQGVTLVVRGDDLTASTPAQILLQRLLGLATPAYAHVPLVVGPDGARLAKRHAGATLADLARRGIEPPEVLRRLATSLGIGVDVPLELAALAAAFRWEGIPRTAWTAPSDLPRSKP